jgi:miniconductance mechanosensitive channel
MLVRYKVKSMESMSNHFVTNVILPLLGGDLDSVYTRLVLAILFVFTVYIICRFVLIALMHKFLKRTQNTWDDFFIEVKFFEKAAFLFALTLFRLVYSIVFFEASVWVDFLSDLVDIAVMVQLIRVLFSLFDAFFFIASSRPNAVKLPLKSILQLMKVFLSCMLIVGVFSILSHRSPTYVLSGFGVATGFILLIFKDTILGFVASIQLSANQMVAQGDWIEVPLYGADGLVSEITLTTVKVKNWDHTISMVPAYALVSSSFKNWRGMKESGGRRIKRSLLIDVQSIRFLSQAEQEEMLHSQDQNHLCSLAPSPVQSQQTTNLGLFRACVFSYLKKHTKLHSSMTCLVRQMAQTPMGLPLEIYVFTNETDWNTYENIQAEIFEFLYASLHCFELKTYQNLGGSDMNYSFIPSSS